MNFGIIQFELDGIDIILPKLSILYMVGVLGVWRCLSDCGSSEELESQEPGGDTGKWLNAR